MSNELDLNFKNGDFSKKNGDLELSGSTQDVTTLEWAIINRLKTRKGSTSKDPNFGSDLHKIRGMPNSRETGDVIKAEIIRCLTYDAMLSSQGLNIEVRPISNSALLIIIDVTIAGKNILTVNIPFSLAAGLVLG